MIRTELGIAVSAERSIVPPQPCRVLYADFVEQGTALYQAAVEQDFEGVVGKYRSRLYAPSETTWVKVKNPRYSQT